MDLIANMGIKTEKEIKVLLGEDGPIVWKRFKEDADEHRSWDLNEHYCNVDFNFRFCEYAYIDKMLDNPEFVKWLIERKERFLEFEDRLEKQQYFKVGYDSCREEGSKEIKGYIDNHLIPTQKRISQQRYQGCTLEFNPHKTTTALAAWNQIIPYWHKVLDRLKQVDQINFILSTIEIHEGKHSKTKKKEKKVKQYTTEQLEEMRPARIKDKYAIVGYVLPKTQDKKTLISDYIKQQSSPKPPVEEQDEDSDCDDKEENEEKVLVSLIGYPHIHFCIGILDYGDGTVDDETLACMIYGLDMDKDVKVGKVKKGEWKKRGGNTRLDMEDPSSLIPYIMKNSRHLQPMKEIYKITNKQTYHPVQFYNFTHSPQLDDVFFLMKERSIAFPFEIMDDKYNVRTEKYIITIEQRTPKIQTKEWNLEQTINFVKSRMEVQKLYVCDEYIYFHHSYTYECLMSAGDFYDKLDFGDHIVSKLKHNKDDQMKKLLSLGGRFQTVKVTDEFYEFDDGIYHVTTDNFYLTKSENMICHMYFEGYEFLKLIEMSDEQFQEMCKTTIKPLRLNDLMTTEIRQLFLDFEKPKYHKKQNLLIQGESNTGKSSFIKALCLLCSRGRLCEPQTGSRFGLGDMHGRHKIRSDEGVGMKQIDIPTLLQLTQGACDLTCAIKYKSAAEIEFKTNWLVVAMDDILGFDLYEKDKCEPKAYNVKKIFDGAIETKSLMTTVEPKYITKDPKEIEALKNRFHQIILKKPIPAEDRMTEPDLDEKILEELPYFFVWLAKSRPITIQTSCVNNTLTKKLKDRKQELIQRVC